MRPRAAAYRRALQPATYRARLRAAATHAAAARTAPAAIGAMARRPWRQERTAPRRPARPALRRLLRGGGCCGALGCCGAPGSCGSPARQAARTRSSTPPRCPAPPLRQAEHAPHHAQRAVAVVGDFRSHLVVRAIVGDVLRAGLNLRQAEHVGSGRVERHAVEREGPSPRFLPASTTAPSASVSTNSNSPSAISRPESSTSTVTPLPIPEAGGRKAWTLSAPPRTRCRNARSCRPPRARPRP